MSDTIEVNREELEEIVDERVKKRLAEKETGYSRRSVLASVAAAAGVGAVGGYPFIQEVTATDGSADGRVGTPSSPVNVYAHSIGDSNNPVSEFYVENQYDVANQGQTIAVDQIGADTASEVRFTDPLSTDEILNSIGDAKLQASYDGLVVPIAQGLGASDAINPANTTTPVQDAVDAVEAAISGATPKAGGFVLLPSSGANDLVQNNGTVTINDNVGIVGHGYKTSGLEITATGVPGIEYASEAQGFIFGGFTLEGPGDDVTTGPAILYSARTFDISSVGKVIVNNWANAGIRRADGGTLFHAEMGDWKFNNIDAGNEAGIIDFVPDSSTGTSIRFGEVQLTPTTTTSGSNSTAIATNLRDEILIDELLMAGSCGELTNDDQTLLLIDLLHIEPDTQVNQPVTQIAKLTESEIYIDHLRKTSGSYDDGFFVTGTTRGLTIESYSGNIPSPMINPLSDPSHPVYWSGDSSQVAPGSAESIWCLGDGRYANPADADTGLVVGAGSSVDAAFTTLTSKTIELATDDIDVIVTSQGAASDFGISVDKTWWDDSAGYWKAQISETEGVTGFTADVEVRR